MALRGLRGSFFSRQGKGAFRRKWSRALSRVDIVAAEPVSPEKVSANDLRERVLAMRGEWR